MTSCLWRLFFLLSLCSSIHPCPVGLKVRVTERGVGAVKDFVLAFFKALENHPFPPIKKEKYLLKFTINELTFTSLHVDRENVVLRLKQETQSLLIEIKDLSFNARFQRNVNVNLVVANPTIHSADSVLTGDGVGGKLNLRMDLQLKRTEGGRLGVQMLECEAGELRMETKSNPGKKYDYVSALLGYLPLKVCGNLKSMFLPWVKSKLENLVMEQQVPAGIYLYLSVNYAVCQDIRVISSGMNLPLRGLVSWKGQEVNVAAIPTGADPDVGAESVEMVYLGISDFFLNSYAAALYKAEAMEKKLNLDNAYVKFWRNIKKIKHRNEDINAEIQIRELPIIHINREEGISVRPRVRVQFISGGKKPKQFQDVTVECKIAIQIEVKQNKLTIPLDKIKCKLETNVVMEWLTKKPLTRIIKNMLYDVLKEGVPIPLPPNINLIQGPAHYRDGFMVLAGSVNWTAEAMKTLAEQMRDHVFRMLE